MKQLVQSKKARFKARITLIIMALFFTITGFAQERNINGQVTDENNIPLPGVGIVIKGTSTGAFTDVNGNYVIKVPGNEATLVVSFIGYEKQEILVGNQTTIKITLKEETTQLDEVVVIGYGTMKKKLTTGANLHISDDKIQGMHSLRIEQALQGMSPGVQITANSGQPGENMKVRIRGVGTVGNSDPIYVVDGTPVQNISYLNPSDIESVDLLKDAASAAIYGTRAANGVLLITTKKGSKGGFSISLDMYTGVQNPYKKLEMLNNEQYVTIFKEKIMNAKLSESQTAKRLSEIDSLKGIANTNWINEMFRKNAPIKSIVASVSGASEKSSYSSSISYYKQEGIIGQKGQSEYERISARLNSENKFYKDIVKFGENMVFTHSEKKGIAISDIYNSSVRGFANTSPTFSVYDYSRPEPDTLNHYGLSHWPDEANPVASLNYKNKSQTDVNQLVGDMYLEITPVKGLTYKTDLGIDMSYSNYNEFKPHYFLTNIDQNTYSYAIQSIDMNFATNFENSLTYSKSIGRHNFNVLAGNTVWQSNRYYVKGQKFGLIFDDFDHAILDNGTIDTTAKPSGTKLDKAMLSYFGRLNYNYNEKYLFSFTLRRDGSSKFGPSNRWGNFPSASVGWIVSQESFAKLNALDFLKLRASWGRNGNDQIPDFLYESTVSSQYRSYYFGSAENKYIGTSPDNIANPNLKWEQSEQLDFGFDARFIKHFSLTFDWYNKKTMDLLINVPISDIAGAGNSPLANSTKIYKNGGDVLNRGYEIALGYQKITNNFSIQIDMNFAYNKNEITRINNVDKIIHGDGGILFNGCNEIYRAEVGRPIGYFYGYKADGIFQNMNEVNTYYAKDAQGNYMLDSKKDTLIIQPKAVAGDVRFRDLNSDGKIDDKDMTMIGKPNPDYTFGFSFDLGYKGFDLSAVAQGVYGNNVIYNIRIKERDYPNYTTEILNRWHGEGTSNRIPRVTLSNKDANMNYDMVSDAIYVYDGSFLKIRSINLGYDLAYKLLKNKIKKCRVYVSALNVFTLTKYPGMDPEVGYGNYDSKKYENFSTGIDIGYYPVPVTYMAGLQVTF